MALSIISLLSRSVFHYKIELCPVHQSYTEICLSISTAQFKSCIHVTVSIYSVLLLPGVYASWPDCHLCCDSVVMFTCVHLMKHVHVKHLIITNCSLLFDVTFKVIRLKMYYIST